MPLPYLDRLAADLDHIRSLGGLAPARLESLRQAARALRQQSARDGSRRQWRKLRRELAAVSCACRSPSEDIEP